MGLNRVGLFVVFVLFFIPRIIWIFFSECNETIYFYIGFLLFKKHLLLLLLYFFNGMDKYTNKQML